MTRLKLRLKVKFLQLNLQGGLAMFGIILTSSRDKRQQRSQKSFCKHCGKTYSASSIHSNLLREIQCSDSCLKEMAQSMHVKFKKYWDEHCLVLAFVVILDPRFKIKFINFSLKKFDADHGNKSRSILDQLKKLFKEYEKVTFPNSAVATSANQDGAHDLDDNLMEFETFDSDGEFGSLSSSGKTQLEFYLSEPRVELTRASFDVLTFWRVNYCRYPELPMMARDILSIPITTVASESTFSIGGRVLNKWRSSLTCTNAQVLIATRNWLYGYEAFEDQKDNFEINGEEINLTTTVRSLSMASEAGSTFEEN
ncbi:hypothetical protein DITRI_Ditri16bG0094500 [Diplodiscus trichospermus]